MTRRVVQNLQGKAPKAVSGHGRAARSRRAQCDPLGRRDDGQTNVCSGSPPIWGAALRTPPSWRARLDIPSIVGLHDVTEHVETGQHVLLDGYNGLLIVNPTPETLWHYGELESPPEQVAKQLNDLRETKSTTRDGRHIVLSANIELPDEVDAVRANGAEGIGLYRTEFLYLNRHTSAGRRRAIRNLSARRRSMSHPHPLIIRTFDLGGDKIAPRNGRRERRDESISGLARHSVLP